MEIIKKTYYLTSLKKACINKNSTIEEYIKHCNGCIIEDWQYDTAEITKELHLNQEEYDKLSHSLLNDFKEFENTGGSATRDPRINNYQDFSKMSEKERATVKWYSCNSVAIFLENDLKYIVNTEGFSYARYVLLPSEKTKTIKEENLPEYKQIELFSFEREKTKTYSIFGKNSTMEQLTKLKNPLPKGIVLIHIGSTKYYVTTGKNNEAVYLSYKVNEDEKEENENSYTYYENFIKPYYEAYGIGLYYINEKIDDEIVDKCIEIAAKREEMIKKHNEYIERTNKEQEAKVLKDYEYLEKIMNYWDWKTINQNIRTHLNKKFPKVKFNISSKQSKISWTNGPTETELYFALKPFVTQDFNKESYNRENETQEELAYKSNFEIYFGRFEQKYITYTRTLTETYKKKAEELISKMFQGIENISKQESPEDIEKAYMMTKINTTIIPDINEKDKEILTKSFWLCHNYKSKEVEKDLLNKLENMLIIKEEPKTQKKETTINLTKTDCEIIDYSEKAIAIIGNTKPHKEKLKEIGAKFNMKLTCGPGWILPKSKKEMIDFL